MNEPVALSPAAQPAQPDARSPQPPSLAMLFVVFTRIGMQSFGGGVSGWIRREVVERRGWVADRPFLSGLAVSQIAPGANSVNLSVFLGSTMRGLAGAAAAFAGMMVLPFFIATGLGALYMRHHALPGVERVLDGVGAGAIGLTLATGARMSRRVIRHWKQALVTVATALAIGVFRLQLLPVLAVTIPLSVLLLGREPEAGRRAR